MIKLILLASGKSYHATRWANALSEKGFQVTFLTIHRIIRPLNENIETIYLGGFGKLFYLFSIPKIRKIIQAKKPDIVHSHTAGGYGFMGLCCGFRPWILSIYGQDIYSVPHKSFFHKTMVKAILSGATYLLSTSNVMAEKTIETYPSVPRPSITPFGVNISYFKKRETSDNTVIKIGIVKKLEKIYGIDILIKAFGRVKGEIDRNIELHIVGGGTELEYLKKLRNNTNYSDLIIFHGAIPNSEVPKFLETIDIFVVPSRSESFGVAAVEASAMELPIIVSDVGGLPEVVENGKTGLVVPPENPEELSQAIKKLILDRDYRKKLGSAGREKVEKEYDWEKNVNTVINIYNEVLESKTNLKNK